MGAAGRKCTSFELKKDNSNCTDLTATQKLKDITTFWWEPEGWSTSFGAEAELNITFNKPETNPDKKIRFKVDTRPLVPNATKPMKGSDVFMLESMLWQLGVSPQKGKGNYGTNGARIASNRSRSAVGAINTQSCLDGLAKKRNIYYRGKKSQCDAGEVSTELMINRFQGRSRGFINGKFNRDVEWNNQQTGDGKVDDRMLAWLKDDWVDYIFAFDQFSNYGRINKNHSAVSQWLDDAVAIWEDGQGQYIPVTYTQSIHEDILTSRKI